MYKVLIFDWDGTVIDSTARIVSSMRRAALDLELGDLTDDTVKNIIGLGLPEAIRVMIPGISATNLEKMRERYGYYYLQADTTQSPLFDGAFESLARLKEKGYILAVATGKSRRGLNQVLKETGTEHLFTATRCADETSSKPDPHMLHELFAELNVKPCDALMIGDTEYDLEMGKRAGTEVVATSYGAHVVSRLLPYEPHIVMNAFVDLENWLDQR